MLQITEIEELKSIIRKHKSLGKSIGLVPTMGSLHEGHMSLVKASVQACDVTVSTVFVNPTQFNDPADLIRYPRNLAKDCKMLASNGCDIVFAPPVETVYPNQPKITLGYGNLEKIMEGKFRPGHFQGVGLIVGKLFNMVEPDMAYFGQKDLQQFMIINQLVNDFNFPIQLVRVPTVRESDGLAMSSRNALLTAAERKEATLIFKSLSIAKELVAQNKSVRAIKDAVKNKLEHSNLDLEYFEIIDLTEFKKVKRVRDQEQLALFIVAYLGKVRLIDNFVL